MKKNSNINRSRNINRSERMLIQLIAFLQLLVFYVLPMFAGPTDAMGLVLLIILATFILSIAIGVIVRHKAKYLYPIATAVLFIPSVFIYYNETALIHSLWYLVVSAVGMAIGTVIGLAFRYIVFPES